MFDSPPRHNGFAFSFGEECNYIMGSRHEFPGPEALSRDDAERRVLPIESAEIYFGVDAFRKREVWERLMADNARGAVADMVALAHRAADYPEGFLTLIGATDQDGNIRSGADASPEEFLSRGKVLLNSIFVPLSARETSGIIPARLGPWLRDLESNLRQAIRETGSEEEFRKTQLELQAKRKDEDEDRMAKAA